MFSHHKKCPLENQRVLIDQNWNDQIWKKRFPDGGFSFQSGLPRLNFDFCSVIIILITINMNLSSPTVARSTLYCSYPISGLSVHNFFNFILAKKTHMASINTLYDDNEQVLLSHADTHVGGWTLQNSTLIIRLCPYEYTVHYKNILIPATATLHTFNSNTEPENDTHGTRWALFTLTEKLVLTKDTRAQNLTPSSSDQHARHVCSTEIIQPLQNRVF